MELGEVQERFAKLIWDNEPIPSGELVKLCQKEFDWKKPTTYTVLRKLCEKGLFINDSGTVRSLKTYDEYCSDKGEEIVEEFYGGSLPAFIAAFANNKKLSSEDIDKISKIIEDMKGR
ncbi:Predicted transcriptional regulator [Oscillospiraceae bacterium]|nr:Predicted transcriptional regulator [Oscillospiraceae bacterium]